MWWYEATTARGRQRLHVTNHLRGMASSIHYFHSLSFWYEYMMAVLRGISDSAAECLYGGWNRQARPHGHIYHSHANMYNTSALHVYYSPIRRNQQQPGLRTPAVYGLCHLINHYDISSWSKHFLSTSRPRRLVPPAAGRVKYSQLPL